MFFIDNQFYKIEVYSKSHTWIEFDKNTFLTGVKRYGKSCRLRWSNSIPDPKHDDKFTSQEEDLIVKLHAAIGSRWSIIAQQLPGRTDNDVKNNWNTKLKKKLSQMGIDPVTHKPFSKLIADYGNIGGANCHINQDFRNQRLIRNTNDQSNQLPPKMETFMDLSQFQTIPITKIENETSNNNPTSMFMEAFLSSPLPTSSPCSSTSTQETNFSAPFSWNDFLLQDAFAPPTNNLQEEQIIGGFLSKKEFMSHQVSSSSDVSFVEAILDQENEMFLSFPELLEEPSNY